MTGQMMAVIQFVKKPEYRKPGDERVREREVPHVCAEVSDGNSEEATDEVADGADGADDAGVVVRGFLPTMRVLV